MQGWTPDFIPKLAEDAVEAGLIDEILPINGADALRLSRELARKEGIFTGISGGATLAGALQVCAKAPAGSKVLCMLPDTGERYLSTPLFADIPAEMSEEEIAIAQSTPRFRFDTQTPAPVPAAAANGHDVAPTPEAEAFVESLVSDEDNPVVMFALEWCEFCWSVRRLFQAFGIQYRSVDLDSVEYQKDDWGGQIRHALRARTASPTIPQVFVGGEHIGGCSETFDAFNEGRLQTLLRKNRVSFDDRQKSDAYSFLPNWLHPRSSAHKARDTLPSPGERERPAA
jgi:cysteine synthase A